MSRKAPHILDVAQAQVSRSGAGPVVFDDPGAAFRVQVWVGRDGRRRYIKRISVETRDPRTGVTAARLARLPTAQLLHVASTETALAADAHPNELFYRMLAQPKPPGSRSWPDDHWERVLIVHDWAVRTNRPGGGARAVAELWGVTVNATVFRWLAEARRRATRRVDPIEEANYGTGQF